MLREIDDAIAGSVCHYTNVPMHYAEIFKVVKIIILDKEMIYFLFSLKHRLWR